MVRPANGKRISAGSNQFPTAYPVSIVRNCIVPGNNAYVRMGNMTVGKGNQLLFPHKKDRLSPDWGNNQT